MLKTLSNASAKRSTSSQKSINTTKHFMLKAGQEAPVIFPPEINQPWIISPPKKGKRVKEWDMLGTELLSFWGFSTQMWREYTELHQTLGPMSELILDMRIMRDREERKTVEGRGVHNLIGRGVSLIFGHRLKKTISIYTKGTLRAEELTHLSTGMTKVSVFPDLVRLYDPLFSGDNAPGSRIKELISLSSVKNEYINWLLFFKAAIEEYHITSLSECLSFGIPIMLIPSAQPTITNKLRILWKEGLIDELISQGEKIRGIQSYKRTERTVLNDGFGSTTLILPNDSRLQTSVESGEEEDKLIWKDLYYYGRVFGNLLSLGFTYESGSAHLQQIVEDKNLDKPQLPVADFLDLIDLKSLNFAERQAYITVSLAEMFQDLSDVFGISPLRLKEEFPRGITGRLEYEKIKNLCSGLLGRLEGVSEDEIEAISRLGHIFGIELAYIYIASRYSYILKDNGFPKIGVAKNIARLLNLNNSDFEKHYNRLNNIGLTKRVDSTTLLEGITENIYDAISILATYKTSRFSKLNHKLRHIQQLSGIDSLKHEQVINTRAQLLSELNTESLFFG